MKIRLLIILVLIVLSVSGCNYQQGLNVIKNFEDEHLSYNSTPTLIIKCNSNKLILDYDDYFIDMSFKDFCDFVKEKNGENNFE